MKKNRNVIGFVVVFIAILYKYLSFYELQSETITKAILFVAILLNVVIIIKRKFTYKQLFMILMPFLVITLISRSLDFVVTLLIAMLFSKDNIRDFFKVFFIATLSCYLLTIFLYFIGVLDNHAIRRITEDEIIVRNSLGFSHVNGVFKNLIPIILSGYFLVKKENIKKYNLFVFIISTILFIVSNSRTGYICVIIYLLLTSFKDIMDIKIIRNSIKYMFIICTIITVLISNYAGKSEDNPINELLSDRPIIWNYYINNVKITDLITYTPTRIHIDNTYLIYILNYGIIAYAIIFLIKYFAIKKIEDKRILLIILILSIYGIFEDGVSYGIDFTIMIQLIYLLDIKRDNLKLPYYNAENQLKYDFDIHKNEA